MAERTVRHAQELGGASAYPGSDAESFLEISLLDLSDLFFKINALTWNNHSRFAGGRGARHGLRQMLGTDPSRAVAAHGHGALNCVFQFTHIPGPCVSRERIYRRAVKILHRL